MGKCPLGFFCSAICKWPGDGYNSSGDCKTACHICAPAEAHTQPSHVTESDLAPIVVT